MSLTAEQVQALLRPINQRRVLRDNKGMTHVSQQDVRAHLTRMFGFGGWSTEVLDLTLVREAPGIGKDGKDKGWAVTYRCTLRLTIRDPQGQEVASYDDVATGTSPNLPTLGDAHDFACKVAVSMALKRAATNLGDGFGLSLYNKGQLAPLVIGTLVMPDGAGSHVEDVPEQVSMGHDDAGSVDHEALVADVLESDRPAERQGRKKKSDPTPPGVDEWSTSDPVWLGEWRTALAAAETSEQIDALAAELKAAIATGQVVPADREELIEAGRARRAALRPVEVDGQVDLLTGEIVEDPPAWPEVAAVPA